MKTNIKQKILNLAVFLALLISVLAFHRISQVSHDISLFGSTSTAIKKHEVTLKEIDSRIAKLGRLLRDLEHGSSNKSNPPADAFQKRELNERVDMNIIRLSQMDPNVLDSIDKKYQLEAKAKKHQAMLIQRKIANQKADVDKYGRGVLDLARRAIGNGQDSDAAYKKLTTEYADTSVAGSVIAERALIAAIDLNTQEVENYYSQLTSNSQYKESVTEQGIEATPALQSYLARQYISTGRFEEANSLIESLSADYGSQFVPEKGEGSRPEWQTGSDVALQLRQELQNATSGGVIPK